MDLRMNLHPLAAACALALGLAACTPAPSSPSVAAPAPDAVAEPAEPAAQPLQIEVYNPGDAGIFAVSSTLVTGRRDAVLIDAQFSTLDARKLVERIEASGKRLHTIYISHGDPDFYFGLETLVDAFPEARVLATPQTIEHIHETAEGKLQYWGPKLGAGAPARVVMPEPLVGDTIDLEGRELRIIGLDGPTPDRSVVWIPSIRTVLGGTPVMSGQHVWMADTQTPQSHEDWLATLDRIAALQPETVIPGHYAPGAPGGLEAVRGTADYIRAFDEETAKAKGSGELIAAMKRRYPAFGAEASLVLSAKVAKGEMAWP
jgi:glyoxylase-like metal-dependent hydrolase (beta-lactamase superfamily II)